MKRKEFMCFNCKYTTDSILSLIHTLIPSHKMYESKNTDGILYEDYVFKIKIKGENYEYI